MTGTLKQVVRDVEPHLPAEFMTVSDIWKSVGCWSRKSVGAALLILWDNGTAARAFEPAKPGVFRYLYRRREQQPDQCERVREAA